MYRLQIILCKLIEQIIIHLFVYENTINKSDIIYGYCLHSIQLLNYSIVSLLDSSAHTLRKSGVDYWIDFHSHRIWKSHLALYALKWTRMIWNRDNRILVCDFVNNRNWWNWFWINMEYLPFNYYKIEYSFYHPSHLDTQYYKQMC